MNRCFQWITACCVVYKYPYYPVHCTKCINGYNYDEIMWTLNIDEERIARSGIAVIDIVNICQHSSAVTPWRLARSECVGLILPRKINGYLTFSPSFPVNFHGAGDIFDSAPKPGVCGPFSHPPSNFFNETRRAVASQNGGEFSGSCS